MFANANALNKKDLLACKDIVHQYVEKVTISAEKVQTEMKIEENVLDMTGAEGGT